MRHARRSGVISCSLDATRGPLHYPRTHTAGIFRMFTWRRGSTFQLGLRAASGTLTGAEVLACQLKPAMPDNTVPPSTVEAVASLAPTFSEGRWILTGTALQSSGVDPGRYVADVRMEIGGVVIVTDPVVIDVVERVTYSA